MQWTRSGPYGVRGRETWARSRSWLWPGSVDLKTLKQVNTGDNAVGHALEQSGPIAEGVRDGRRKWKEDPILAETALVRVHSG
jgi:hypothetical protein